MTFADVAATMSLLTLLLLALTPVLSKLLAVYHLRGAAQQIFAELQRARLSAVMQNNRHTLSVVDGTSAYALHDDNNNDDQQNDGSDTVVVRDLQTDSPGISLSAASAITFAPNGAAPIHGTITLTNASGSSRTIAVSAGGRVRLLR